MPSSPAERREIAQIAALTRVAKEPSGTAMTQKARDEFWASFETGHQCRLCPPVLIDQTLPDDERERQVTALRRAHFARCGRNARKGAAAAGSGRAPASVLADAV